ncbi:MAG: hypothetical protein E6Q97_32080 [Desulfurellales bacterium]|nr:MAG: hypothetical protein E6Q97_32080 [Desulfurellales bacterium]
MSVIIDDSTDLSQFAKEGRGLIPRDFSAYPFGSFGFAAPFSEEDEIPEEQWPDLISDMVRTKSRLSDILADAMPPVKPFHQGQTSTCWAQAAVYAVQCANALQGKPTVLLSPASVAGPITGYRDQGGWPTRALEYIVDEGVAEQSLWAPNAVTKNNSNAAGVKESRVKNKVTEWRDLKPRRYQQTITNLIRRRPVIAAYNKISHAVLLVDPVIGKNGSIDVFSHNSGYMRDSNGHTTFARSFGPPDEQIAPHVTTGG